MTRTALIVAHGQPSDPMPAARALERLAVQVAGHLQGWEVRAATLAEPGAIAREVAGQTPGIVFPMFMTGGWFTRVQIPARLIEAGATGWRMAEPFGCDPAVHDLCVTLVREAATGAETGAATDQVILAAHGSFKSSVPSDIARHVAGRIAAEAGVRCAVGFIDQEPRLVTLTKLGGVCLPFFAAEGGHVTDDIPAALVAAGFAGRILPAVGLDARVPGIIAAALGRDVPACHETCLWAKGQNP